MLIKNAFMFGAAEVELNLHGSSYSAHVYGMVLPRGSKLWNIRLLGRLDGPRLQPADTRIIDRFDGSGFENVPLATQARVERNLIAAIQSYVDAHPRLLLVARRETAQNDTTRAVRQVAEARRALHKAMIKENQTRQTLVTAINDLYDFDQKGE